MWLCFILMRVLGVIVFHVNESVGCDCVLC